MKTRAKDTAAAMPVVRGEMRMSKLFRVATGLAAVAAFFALSASRSWAQDLERMEVGAAYSYVKTNAPPGACGCFSMNGGEGWFAYNFSRAWAAVGEIGAARASNIDGTTGDFTLTSFLGGPRYSWRRDARVAPFGQVLIGGAHGSGVLTPSLSGLPSGASAFAMSAGGGVDAAVSRHWAVRLVEVDYYLTRFNNATNHHQNNLRIGVGIAYRFGGRGK
jgi:outer membrane immunogenic protein